MEETDTGEKVWLGRSILESAKNLRTGDFSNAVRQVSTDFRIAFQADKDTLGATFNMWESAKLSELIFAGFDDRTALIQRVHFERTGEILSDPLYEPEPMRLGAPTRYIRYQYKEKLPLAIYDPTNPERLPQGFSLEQAEREALACVRSAIVSGDPTVGGQIQLAKIPRGGNFVFVEPPPPI